MMEFNFDIMNEESFFSEEVIAVQLRNAGLPWRQEIPYTNLPPRLQKISEFIIPIVNGVKTFSVHYNQEIGQQFLSITRGLLQTPEGNRCDFVYNTLKFATMAMFSSDDEERSIFAFISLVAEVCRWLIETNQADLVYEAAASLRFFLTIKFPGGLISMLERLRDYV